MSSKNPFRTHFAQSSGTAHASDPRRPESPPLPPLPSESSPSSSSPDVVPPSEPSLSENHHSSEGSDPTAPSHLAPSGSTPGPSGTDVRIDDDLPPAYTPSADASIGEETLELGPRRPFQQPQRHPDPSLASYAPSGSGPWPQFLPPSGPPLQSWSTSSPQNLAPWQTQYQYEGQRHGRGGGLIGSLLREVVDAVSGTHDERMITQRANASVYAAPYPQASAYAPPPGPPPQVQPPARPRSTPPNSSRAIPDDGTPTRVPVPGHPLLRDGNLLVYPKDHLCTKCKNTGYKNYDPSHPCHKCWEKYAKPYTGPLTYTPWSASGNDPRMQRALPRFVPPHLAPVNPRADSGNYSRHTVYPPPPQHPQHNRSSSNPTATPTSQMGPSYYVVNPLISWDSTPPVPHAIPVSPGDPRLGGWLCTQCGGEGVRTLFLFDMTTCETCGGTGRIWR